MPAGLDLLKKYHEVMTVIFAVLVAAGIVGCAMMHVYVWR